MYGHKATYAPEGAGYLVTCPHGCPLGTAAHVADEAAAIRRVHLHQIATDTPARRAVLMNA